MLCSLVSNWYWDDHVELCCERGQLHRADPDFRSTEYFTLQHLYMARYAVCTQPSNHISLTLTALFCLGELFTANFVMSLLSF